MDSFFFYQLIDKYLDGTASEDERRFVEASYEALSRDGGKNLSAEELAEWRERIYAEVVRGGRLVGTAGEMAGEQDAVNERGAVVGKGRIRVLKNRTWWRVAAVLLLVVAGIAGGLILYRSGRNDTAVLSQKEQRYDHNNDIAPARQGAVLTLGDGRKIRLDSVGNGRLAMTGASRVIKQDGSLVYAGGVEGGDAVYNTVSTGKGYIMRLRLPDGTGVWLDALSTIRFPTAFTGGQRRVTITGQAYFEVADDAARPFQVQARGMRVHVLGTHFNVNAYDDESMVATTVLEGSVKISSGDEQAGALLKPGDQAQLNGKGGIVLLHSVNMQEVMAWKNGFFKFENAGLEAVMRQLSRWYDVEVEYRGVIDPSLQFGGKMGKDLHLQQVLKILQGTSVAQAHFTIEGRKIIIVP